MDEYKQKKLLDLQENIDRLQGKINVIESEKRQYEDRKMLLERELETNQ